MLALLALSGWLASIDYTMLGLPPTLGACLVKTVDTEGQLLH